MSHVRKQIRDAVVAALAPLGRVTTRRIYPTGPDDLPTYSVRIGDEQATGAFDLLERTVDVVVECTVRGDIDDEADDCLVAVEKILGEQTLGGVVVHLVLKSIEISESGEGAAPIGRARMTYEALYRTSFTDPETSI